MNDKNSVIMKKKMTKKLGSQTVTDIYSQIDG